MSKGQIIEFVLLLSFCHPLAMRLLSFCDPILLLSLPSVLGVQCSMRGEHFHLGIHFNELYTLYIYDCIYLKTERFHSAALAIITLEALLSAQNLLMPYKVEVKLLKKNQLSVRIYFCL